MSEFQLYHIGERMRILVIGDTHFPFACKKTLNFIYRSIESAAEPPTHILQVGDLFDFFSWSRFPKSANLFTPTEELKAGLKSARRFWEKINELAPDAKKYQLKGNHDERIIKRLFEKAPEFEDFLDLSEIWNFPGVKVQPSEREELVINDIVFIHGYRSKTGDHARFNLKNTVCGHLHRGGVVFIRHDTRIIWELNAGCAADLESQPMSYGKQRQFNNMTNGFGWIDDLGPRFIPLVGGKTWKKM